MTKSHLMELEFWVQRLYKGQAAHFYASVNGTAFENRGICKSRT